MNFTLASALLMGYQFAAIALGWTKVSNLHGSRARVRDLWWLLLGLHFFMEAHRGPCIDKWVVACEDA